VAFTGFLAWGLDLAELPADTGSTCVMAHRSPGYLTERAMVPHTGTGLSRG
jgi:hypothetical protein